MDRRTLTFAMTSAVALLASAASSQLRLQTYVTGLNLPVAMIQDPVLQDTQYVVQKEGVIRVIKNGVLQSNNFIDLTGSLNPNGEKFLFSLAFPLDYAQSGKVYVCYVDQNADERIQRFNRSSLDPRQLDPASGQTVMIVGHSLDHWGGTIHFGMDGYLYLGTGDGSLGNDPDNNAQNPQSYHGKFLRIDPSRDDFPADPNRNYGIPADNPFLFANPITALPEVWAFGMRNPWKWSFDMPALGGNGAMLIADVGQTAYEEVDYEPLGAGGRDYGWRQREGAHDSGLGGASAFTPLTDPIFDYSHNGGGASITGGYVYHGSGLPAMYRGRYFFADFVTSQLFSFQLNNGIASNFIDHTSEIGSGTAGLISSVDIDALGEIYLVEFNPGNIRKLVARSVSGTVTLQNYSVSVAGLPITIEIRSPGSATALETHTVTLAADGSFTVPTSITDGTYDIAAKGSHWLRATLTNRSLGYLGAGGLSFSLPNGDINGDNAVTLGDFARLRAAYGSTPSSSNWNPEADLNGDGAVTLGDFAVLRSQYGRMGDT